MLKRNNVYGVLGVGVKNGNYNASFDKSPKQNSLGEMYASPQCMGFAIKHQLQKAGEKILYKRSIGEKGVRSLAESYEYVTDTPYKNTITENEVKAQILNKCKDIRLFGCTFAVKPVSFGILGAVQIGMGFNKYEDTEEMISELLAPFYAQNSSKKTSKKEESIKIDKEGETNTLIEQFEDKEQNNTLGEQVIVDEAHYLHSFTVDPYEYDQYVNVVDGFEGFTEKDYEDFKNASLIAVSNYNSKSKSGCQNEFALFIEGKTDNKNIINLNVLDQYIKVYKDNDKVIYNLMDIKEILSSDKVKDKIESIELYYNSYTMDLKPSVEEIKKSLNKIKVFNIITRKEL